MTFTDERRRRGTLVAITFLAFISLGLPDAVLGVAWPSIQRTFGLPVSQLGLLLTTSMVGYLTASFASGETVRRLGVGGLLLASSGLVVASLAGYALAPAWWVMVACGLLAGLGAGAIDAGLNAYAAAHFPPRWVTWLHACYGIGAMLGPLAMTAVLTAGLAWPWGYAAIGAVLVGMAVLFAATRRLWQTPPTADADSSAAPAVVAAGFTDALRRPAVWMNVVLFFLYTGIEVTAGQWAYSLFTKSRGVSPAAAGVWVGAYWASLTLGRIVFGATASRVSKDVILRGATIAAPVAAAMIWSDAWPLVSLLGLALLGFALAPIFPMLISATPDRLGPAYAQQAIGFQVAAATCGAAAVPSLAGVLARAVGLEVLGPYLLVATIALLVLHEMAARLSVARVTLPVAGFPIHVPGR